MEFVSLNILPAPPKIVEELDPLAKGFKGYRVVKEETTNAPTSSCSFAADGNLFAVAQSTRLSVWNLPSATLVHRFERFKDLVTACAFRADGKLLLAGDATGKTSVLNIEGKSTLKRLNRHKGAVTCAGFGLLRTNCVTGGKDKTVRYWDVTSAEEVAQWEAHDDGVQCLANSPVEEMVVASGSHDGTVKLWDLRESSVGRKAILTLNHGHPVESICYYPSSMMLLSAGSTIVNVWDLSKGSVITSFGENNARTITSCSLDAEGETCFTTSLDGTAKVYDASSYRMLYSYALPKPALCGQWSPTSESFVVGLDNGWQVRRAKKIEVERAKEGTATRPKTGAARFYKRGKREKPQECDEVVEMARLPKQSTTDYFLRKFKYKKALVACVLEGPPAKVWTFLDEMAQRGSLENCVKNLDQAQILSVLQWILGNFPPEGPQRVLFFDFVNVVMDQDALHGCSSPAVVDMIRRINMKVCQELGGQQHLKPLLGILDSVLVA